MSRATRDAALAVMIVAFCAGHGFAQTAPEKPRWDLSAAVYTYFLPAESDYLQPTFMADRGPLHLEARANYEALRTGSAWIGWNVSLGSTVTLDVTPMFGAVFGETKGVAPGYRTALTWSWLELSSEGEYVFSSGDRADWFFYTWSEVAITPVDWLRAGLVGQRTRAYKSDRDIQRGFFAGYTSTHFDITGYVFNPDDDDPFFVLTVGVNFSLPRRPPSPAKPAAAR